MKVKFVYEDGSESNVPYAPLPFRTYTVGDTIVIDGNDYIVVDCYIDRIIKTYPVSDVVSHDCICVKVKKKINDAEINALVKAGAYKYIEIKKHGTKWKTYLVVGVQSFAVCDETTKTRARWFADMLAKALVMLVDDVKGDK